MFEYSYWLGCWDTKAYNTPNNPDSSQFWTKWWLVGVTGKFYRVTVCSVFLFTPEDLHMLDLDVGCIVMQATLVSVEVSNHQSDTGPTSTRLV